MPLNPEQARILEHLEQVEELGELVISKQEQSVLCDKNRQQTREALSAVSKLSANEEKQWVMLSDQFFLLPRNQLIQALRDDLKTYNSEVDRLREELKADINMLRELEGNHSLKGFDLTALSKEDIESTTF
ncbi:p53 and DNA damage-regulated protein 1 [Clonorchis sinensis]|uniref:p53 and DNA damage-regulated protein 1 n=1 Tax=Clonorchis sinensis TaxID=79923 RepID=H2KU20_CLOSI|nr:p53 and DNA damage-regulated protein 1 [Clonorchis sinensis]